MQDQNAIHIRAGMTISPLQIELANSQNPLKFLHLCGRERRRTTSVAVF
jgi:hypothetical protein